MMEVKDQGITLFGKKIASPEDGNFTVFSGEDAGGDYCGAVSHEDSSTDRELGLMETNDTCLADKKVNSVVKGQQQEEQTGKDNLAEEQHSGTKPEDKMKNSKASPESDDNPKTPSTGEESATLKPPKTENDRTGTTKVLKKPDKILPCPRCNSMDTKFCYYNNYNVNQPRHFCKSCQRYWTAGGTMRNVPVGAGRRKNKNSASNCSNITISDGLQATRVDPSNGPHHPTFKTNGTVLSFNSDRPLCESMACVLNLAEKNSPNGTRNGDDCSSGSFATISTSTVESGENGFPSQVPCIPWPYPWNSSIPLPIPSGIPIPFYPAPYWSYNVPGPWSINPWLSPPATPNQKESVVMAASSLYSLTLGKHSREGELLKPSNVEVKEPSEQKNPESTILVPKTLRIDDPDEAAKSSIWETLGIKNDCISRGGLFKAFERKGEKNHVNASASPVLQANPAAMSRSLSFQERA